MSEELIWDDESATYIRLRQNRYPGAIGIQPARTQEVMADADLAALEPDPKSRMGASRFVCYSPTAGRVLVVSAFRDTDGDLHGINAWPASGADLKIYRKEATNGQDD